MYDKELFFDLAGRQCGNCALWDKKTSADIPCDGTGEFSMARVTACLCRAGNEAESDPLLAGVHDGVAAAFTVAEASCRNWQPAAWLIAEMETDEGEFWREAV